MRWVEKHERGEKSKNEYVEAKGLRPNVGATRVQCTRGAISAKTRANYFFLFFGSFPPTTIVRESCTLYR